MENKEPLTPEAPKKQPKKSTGKFFVISMSVIFVIGLLLIWGLHLFVNQDFSKKEVIGVNPVTSAPVSLTLNLSSPDDDLLVFEPDILVQGKVTPNSTVLLSSEDKDQVVEITPDGNFTLTLKLVTGLNNLTLIVFDALGNSKNENRTIYYSQEKI